MGDEEAISRRVAEWERSGFINYFGSQRFGTSSVATWQVGRELVLGNWGAAVDLILAPRAEDEESVRGCHLEWAASKDPAAALTKLSGQFRSGGVEAALLRSLSVHGRTDFLTALQTLPRHSRSLYVHAYQSWLWNRIVARRVAKHGQAVLVGDLLRGPDKDNFATVKDPADVSPFDIILPLPSGQIRFPENEIAGWYNEIFLDEGVSQGHFAQVSQDFALHSSQRPVFVKPLDVSHRFVSYSDPTKLLLPNDMTQFQSDWERQRDADAARTLDEPARALLLNFALPSGCYATVALREICKRDLSKQGQLSQLQTKEEEKKKEEKKEEEKKEEEKKEEKEEESGPGEATNSEQRLPGLKPAPETAFIGPVIPQKRPRIDQ